MYPHGRNGVPQKICVRGAEASRRRGELEVVFTQVLEDGSYRHDVGPSDQS